MDQLQGILRGMYKKENREVSLDQILQDQKVLKKALKKAFGIFEKYQFIRLSSYFAVWKICTIQTRMQLSKVFIGSVEMEKVDAADNNLLNSSRISALNYSKWQ